ncbi:hypothetical protein EZV62_027022 [Acer yangbiense]|uniref:non-specific serine/threonine protein kinase n=1 Tax=Acer yangbiense TaxID=1000413 RepID=A0A5C7GSN5_9ROSI|nr:hypothetical protein EZV62_027022 [Acer yangbiense]
MVLMMHLDKDNSSNDLIIYVADYQSFHINCGGPDVTINNTMYEGDGIAGKGAILKYDSRPNWGFISAGDFMDDGRINVNAYIVSADPNTQPELYSEARGSPLFLTYYGYCLESGNYTVDLHFAEIFFRDEEPYYKVGRRIFDIYIQDFNIKEQANGTGKAIIKTFNATVTENTLEIRLYWAGKGTTVIPMRGYYGPLISAISVCHDLKRLDLQTGTFTFKQLKDATNNFNSANKLGEGGFGSVYKVLCSFDYLSNVSTLNYNHSMQGQLLNGTIISMKQLSSKSRQGNREFVYEIGMISSLQHPNLVKHFGCYVEGSQLLLVYEYMENIQIITLHMHFLVNKVTFVYP